MFAGARARTNRHTEVQARILAEARARMIMEAHARKFLPRVRARTEARARIFILKVGACTKSCPRTFPWEIWQNKEKQTHMMCMGSKNKNGT